MPKTNDIIETAETLVDLVQECDGDQALEAVLVTTSFVLHWNSYKLFELGETGFAQAHLQAAKLLEGLMIDKGVDPRSPFGNVVRFPK